jgi:hypothetical protein
LYASSNSNPATRLSLTHGVKNAIAKARFY